MKLKTKLLSLVLCVVMMITAVPVYAEDSVESITAYATIAVAGDVKVAYQKVTVTDQNESGTFDIDDVLYAAHEAYYDGGAAAGYASYTGDWGLSLGKLWGTTDGIGGYRLNNANVATSLAETVKDGDYIAAYTYGDTTAWSDEYSFFDKTTAEVKAGEEVAFTVKYQSYDADWNLVDNPLADAVITVDGKDTEYKTDKDGKVTVPFEKAGTYLVSAKCEGKTLVPAVCTVAVEVVVPFTDVEEDSKFYEAICWAYANEITNGKTETTYQPKADCTRGQVVTFIWRANGCPEPTIKENPFTDVSTASPFYKAILWAYEHGITKGKTVTTFQPDVTVNREQVVTFLWRAEGKADASIDNPFADVADNTDFTEAILWAYENGITTGKTATIFQPKATCIREQVAAFLYRTYA